MYVACSRHDRDANNIMAPMVTFIKRLLCARDYAKHFSCIPSLNSHNNSLSLVYYPYLKDEKTEVQRIQGHSDNEHLLS